MSDRTKIQLFHTWALASAIRFGDRMDVTYFHSSTFSDGIIFIPARISARSQLSKQDTSPIVRSGSCTTTRLCMGVAAYGLKDPFMFVVHAVYSVQILFGSMTDDLRRQVHLLTLAVQQMQSNRPRGQFGVCIGQRRLDHHTYRKTRDMGTYWHEPHVIDADPDGMFAAFHLLPSAPIELLWDQISLEETIEEERLELFTYIRDHRGLYERCVDVFIFFFSMTWSLSSSSRYNINVNRNELSGSCG